MRLLLPFVIALSVSLHAADPLLIENGQARAEIVIAENPARMTKLAAKELQTYLEKISGAKLEVRIAPTAGKAHIFLGKSSHTEALKLATDGLENGAFRMASGADWLALLGPDEDYVPIEPWGRVRSTAEQNRVFWNHFGYIYARYHKDLDVWDYDDAGTLNAVYEFLRSLGVRWYAPGELGEVVPKWCRSGAEVVPKLATIALPGLNKTVKPDFGMRRFTFYTDHTGIGDKGIWTLRLGLNQGHKIGGISQICHGMKFVLCARR